jgi:hypothetical protein
VLAIQIDRALLPALDNGVDVIVTRQTDYSQLRNTQTGDVKQDVLFICVNDLPHPPQSSL